jgi:(p)ppGpp synthase/HD superfamily hydrolase
MSTIEKAIEIAINAHKDQKDKSGAPYILHLIRVMEMGKKRNGKSLWYITRFGRRYKLDI